ncbi:MAG: EscU/YscU/HrcU family type III secretion system export apparatus switch protein [Gammaproteobacteria bacterium]|nr:EscU/YscU/HrcU family type III secretion system export apparatus switch protein [Gammaproteobacteria bacterium]MBT8150565.1 EscU/YscU/HrcU family type III secretion system export apparatus switch protein [Gammaproteobacteria bacterium]NND38343.1 flagellar biosynthesis protein FlhB [Pseudomonadales bacterium]NNM12333.1 flagellar biosynthesis protein FlhB [Pseudomonadales bacterium]RZV60159.1 MAG: flagellar biosynthesis protein FlhB [Pseudomonadales bacterium]
MSEDDQGKPQRPDAPPGKRQQAVEKPAQQKQAIEQYQRAIALQYDGKRAPQVTASGSGQLAEEIIALARASGVPLYENAELTEMLAALDLGEQIPHELYVIIAQIIALAYKISGKAAPL